MNITVIGTGYVGLVTGTCLAHIGHTVTCVDNDSAKVSRMQAGDVPIYEPGLSDIFVAALQKGSITITTSLADGIKQAEAIFLALPTPPEADGGADLSAVLQVADELGGLLERYTVIINKSTVPVGTGERVAAAIARRASKPHDAGFDIVSNPEFLREGLAVKDCLHPDRIVIGSQSERANRVMRRMYEPLFETASQADNSIVWMDVRSAEMTKYAANSFLAMKVSFMNEIANLCELVGANVDNIRLGIGPDQRIGSKFLYAGIGFGGSCFPKDVQALLHTAADHNYDFKLLKGIIEVNGLQKQRLTDKLLLYYQGGLKGKHFAIWGLAFKPDTDDIREAPALDIISRLLAHGATVTAYDPQATDNAKRYFGDQAGLTYVPSAADAAQTADALLITTEWDEFRHPDFAELRRAMVGPVIFDGRNLYEPDTVRAAGFTYMSIGRPLAASAES